IKDSYFNLSGVETKLLKGIGEEDSVVARTVLTYIKDVLVKSIDNAIMTTGIKNVLLVGGVASNEIIRNGLEKELNVDLYFASKELSSDNAVGIAILAYMAEEKNNG
ncbi:MAG: peptidase M22, partial [Oscillospiraceae bacterium]|nr:peptidase M22 [Oscillospiraceae bacterium]